MGFIILFLLRLIITFALPNNIRTTPKTKQYNERSKQSNFGRQFG